MMGNKTMRTNNTGSIPLCEKLDTKRRNVKEAHTQREQGGELTTSSMCLKMERVLMRSRWPQRELGLNHAAMR